MKNKIAIHALLALVLAVCFSKRAAAENLINPDAATVTHAKQQPLGTFLWDDAGKWTITPPRRTEDGRNDMHVTFPVNAPLPKGGGLVFECEMRAVSNQDGVAAGQAGLVLDIEQAGADPAKKNSVFRHILLAGPDWETFRVPIEADQSAPTGSWQLALAPSYFEQVVEMRDVRLRALRDGEEITPAVSYPGQQSDAEWRQLARERIRKNRMGDLTVRVVDPFGKPVPGARITLKQTRHAYRFGTCVVANRLVDADVTFRDAAMTREQFLRDNARYREEILRLFNFVVFENDLKWPAWGGINPNRQQADTLRAMEWLRSHHILIKGHTLVWGSWKQTPGWLESLKNDKPALQAAILRHIRDISAATGAFTSFWDVLNEPMSHRDIIELLGHEAVADWFRVARESLPGQPLLLNEFDMVGNGGSQPRRERLIALVHDLQKLGGAPDIIGFQSHFWSNRLTPPETIWKILDEVHGATGLPIAATEFDLNFPNDRVQADYTRDFLTAWFAHPATDSFIMWGFWGGAHWFGERGAMFRRDWTPKPNLKAYTDLVLGEWWTTGEGITDKNGEWQARGFLGDYEMVVELDGRVTASRRPTIPKAGLQLEVVLTPNPAEANP